jgi:hypothetical protein
MVLACLVCTTTTNIKLMAAPDKESNIGLLVCLKWLFTDAVSANNRLFADTQNLVSGLLYL